MASIILDTLDFANKLKAGGFTEQQAETQTKAIAEIIEKQLVTQQSANEREQELKRDIHESETKLEIQIKEIDHKIELLRADLKKDMAETKAELIRWVVGVGLL